MGLATFAGMRLVHWGVSAAAPLLIAWILFLLDLRPAWPTVMATLAYAVGPMTSIALALMLVRRAEGGVPEGLRAILSVPTRTRPSAALLVSSSVLLLVAVDFVLGLTGGSSVVEQSQETLDPALEWRLRAVNLMFGVSIFPLCEEMSYRLVLYATLRRILSVPASILISVPLFLFEHIPGSISTSLSLAAFCVVSSYGYERSRSFVVPLLIHIAYNAAVSPWSTL